MTSIWSTGDIITATKLNRALDLQGDTMTGNLNFDNALSITIDDAGGSARNVLSVDAGDDIYLGNSGFDDIVLVGAAAGYDIYPATDNNADLGKAGNRFKDVNFSGGLISGAQTLDIGGAGVETQEAFIRMRTWRGPDSVTVRTASAGGLLELHTKNNVSADTARLSITGALATSVATWANVTHTGIVLSGNLDVNSQSLTNVTGLVANSDLDIGAYELKAETLESDIATGTAPLTVASTTKVANLNVEQVEGFHLPTTGLTPVATGWNTAPTTLTNFCDDDAASVTGTGTGAAQIGETENVNEILIDLGANMIVTFIWTKIGLWSSESTKNVQMSVRAGGSGTASDAEIYDVTTMQAATETVFIQHAHIDREGEYAGYVRYISIRFWADDAAKFPYVKLYECRVWGRAA